jgi:hypothetical protein
MSNTFKKNQEASLHALYEQLEVRYGAGLAQEIVDQIKKTEDQDNKPEFMAVKAISEVLELFRADAQEIVKKLKIERSKGYSADIVNLDEKRLQNDLNNIFKSYWLVQHGFYQSYNKALKICEVPETYRYDKYTKPTKMKMAA